MSFGLDIGSRGVRCLHRSERTLRGRRSPACYITLPQGAAEKLLLQRAFIPFSACDGSYIVIGDNAIELSQALKVPLIPVFPDGRLPVDDPVGRQVAATLIESVLPKRDALAGPSTMVVPGGGGAPGSRNSRSLEGFAERVLSLRGVQCTTLSAGTASILAELSDREFTGAGLNVGASSTSLSIAVHGQPIAELSHPRGCDRVDDTFARSRGRYFFDSAGNRYLDLHAVARWRESSGVDLASPEGDDQELLRSLVREWLLEAMSEFTQRLEALPAARAARGISVLVVNGGPSRMTGFDVLVADAIRRAQLPLNIAEIRTGSPSEYALARGCLIAAELERKVETRRAA